MFQLYVTCINMSEIKNIAGTEFDELLQQVHLGELNVVNLCINQRLAMSEKRLGIVSVPANELIH